MGTIKVVIFDLDGTPDDSLILPLIVERCMNRDPHFSWSVKVPRLVQEFVST